MVLATWWFDDRQPSIESVTGLRCTRNLERALSPGPGTCDDDAERRSSGPCDFGIAAS